VSPTCVWDDLIGQRDAVGFLKSATMAGVSHAYLFVGPPGAGKKTAARALACALICDDEGCGSCRACYRIKRGFHPDVRIVGPEGAASYMVPQIRELIREVGLTPAEAHIKVFIVESADMLNDASANAFLKTLEEPPDNVVMILLAPTFDSVIPTISSRCQTVRFRRVPPDDAVQVLTERTGAQRREAVAALAATGGVMARAREFLESSARQQARELMLRTLKDLPVMDGHDVLKAARDILAAVKAPLEEIRVVQAEEIREREEFLGTSAGKELQEKHKRQLTAKEREAVAEILNIAESWLRDCLVLSQDIGSLVSNEDHRDAMDEVAAAMTPEAAVRALDAVNEARRRISYNVNPQLAVEAMLYDLQEVLKCPR
jgi:DNA polymerase-3 subunit delta'